MTALGQVLAIGGTGLYVDLECAVQDTYALKLGVDFRDPGMGGSGQAIRVQPHTFEETESLVTMAALQGIDLIVIDSVAAFVSRRDAKRDANNEDEKKGVAEIPRLMSAWMPKLQNTIARTKTCVIFLNQTRDKIGAKGFTEEALKSTTGGNALKFYAALRVLLKPRMSTKAKVWNPIIKAFQDVQISTDIEAKMIKNKLDAKQGHAGLITIRYGVGIDELRTMLNVAEAYNIVKKSKNKKKQEVYTFTSAKTGNVIEQVGLEKFRLALLKTDDGAYMHEMIHLATEAVLSGYQMLDDEQLAALADDAVTKRDDDDYEDDDNEPAKVVDVDIDTENSEESEEGITAEPAIDAGDI
jgi:RecA/RadA recombinase